MSFRQDPAARQSALSSYPRLLENGLKEQFPASEGRLPHIHLVRMSAAALRDKILAIERTARLKTGPLVPLLPPKPRSRPLPPLPPRISSAPPFGFKHPEWKLDTFVVPAAFPRTPRNSTKPPVAATKKPTGERDDASAAVVKIYDGQAAGSREEVDMSSQEDLDQQQQLYTVVNRYRPESGREGEGKGLTLVFSHANGFHKGEQSCIGLNELFLTFHCCRNLGTDYLGAAQRAGADDRASCAACGRNLVAGRLQPGRFGSGE